MQYSFLGSDEKNLAIAEISGLSLKQSTKDLLSNTLSNTKYSVFFKRILDDNKGDIKKAVSEYVSFLAN